MLRSRTVLVAHPALLLLQKVNSFKFGVLYAKENQDEIAMYNNRASALYLSHTHTHLHHHHQLSSACTHSPRDSLLTEEASEGFDNFVSMLGDKIQLEGWTKYSAGLNTNRTSSFVRVCPSPSTCACVLIVIVTCVHWGCAAQALGSRCTLCSMGWR
jgi:hypothetical protein